MVLEGKRQTVGRCRLDEFRECFDELPFSAQKIAQLLDEELLNQLRLRCRAGGSIVDARIRIGVTVRAELLERRRLDELPVFALIPRATGVDLAVFAETGRIIEELVDQAGGWRNLGRLRIAAS